MVYVDLPTADVTPHASAPDAPPGASAPDALDQVFAALSHGTRRRLVRYLAARNDPPRMSQVAHDNGVSPQLLNKHTAVLERAGLVRRTAMGRESLLVINRSALVDAQKWILDTRAFWEGQFDALDSYIEDLSARGELPGASEKE